MENNATLAAYRKASSQTQTTSKSAPPNSEGVQNDNEGISPAIQSIACDRSCNNIMAAFWRKSFSREPPPPLPFLQVSGWLFGQRPY
ncbi:hypothetical protein JTE90_006358 [Oedothorax gibbosus]|uniref:Uncharacterized protein n=1 Tax=Oedothorax gibbosus TaxID=931172 RepID=A0AAV6VYI9_9ARAC|nr:hypothetical protein JTE90_006358 [Oedothorax gibbosus]